MATSTPGPSEVKVYGLDLTNYSPRAQFIVLGGGALISALVFAFLQEKVRVCVRALVCGIYLSRFAQLDSIPQHSVCSVSAVRDCVVPPFGRAHIAPAAGCGLVARDEVLGEGR